MDTLFSKTEKSFKLPIIALNAAITLVLCLSFQKTLLAQENVLIANTITPIINTGRIEQTIDKIVDIEKESKFFNESVKRRYSKGIIKDVTSGVKHIRLTKYYNKKAVKINVIEINRTLNPNLKITPVLASETLNNKVSISKMAKNSNSIVAVNGTFFKPQSGVPLGTLMINGEMQTGPIYDRVAIGIFENHFDTARIQLNANLITKNSSVKIDNINQPRMLSTYTLMYTSKWGKYSPPTPKYGMQLAVENNRVIATSLNPLPIPKNGFVISAPKNKINSINIGDVVKADISTIPGWESVVHIISGGPYLLKKGQVFIDIKEEKLPAITGRNPRTAVGYTPDNHLIIVTVDGREKASVGMTLGELASFMKSVGCYEALNLDGGGSSVLYVNGNIVNNPAQKGGIALSNALTVSLD